MFIIGHQNERARLRRMVESGNMAQSYLFVGPQGVGKSLVALEFACMLVGEPDFEPTTAQAFPLDVLVLRPKKETKRGVTKEKNIAAEDVREAFPFLSRYPVRGRFRVVIIDEAHRLSLAAQNVLLKTLEEPISTAVIILVTHSAGSLVSTILSRVAKTVFRFVPSQAIEAGVRGLVSETEEPIAPFFLALGRPGLVITALDDRDRFSREQADLSLLFRITTLSLLERLSLSERLAKEIPTTIRVLEWWLPGLYDQAIRQTDPKKTGRFFQILEQTEAALGLLKTTQSNARLILEKLFLSV